MSAILSSDDLNDFISPGVACIKPVETLPRQRPDQDSNPYEVTTEDKVAATDAPPAQISLTDCLACSGCVTSAEAVLVSLQSHAEVLSTLDAYPSLEALHATNGPPAPHNANEVQGKLFVASVSPQTRANIAATYGVTSREAGFMIEQLLSGPDGLMAGGTHGSSFTWVLDTNVMREVCQEAAVAEALAPPGNTAKANSTQPKRPILSSACPGWICYAEKTHPHVLPHLSRLKSPQALTGTLLKSVLSRRYGISPAQIWHLAVMPCFDKKLEASREELTDVYWTGAGQEKRGVRDVDCVITARELLMLANTRGISFPSLSRRPADVNPFPDATLDQFLFPRGRRQRQRENQTGGPSGGYAYHVLRSQQAALPGSRIHVEKGRNADVIEYTLTCDDEVIMKTARYYGFRNIQNLVRRLKPSKVSRLPGSKTAATRRLDGPNPPGGGLTGYAHIEVMACPGGCTNGGGQVKVSDMADVDGVQAGADKPGPAEQKEWLARVDEAYYSAESSDDEDAMNVDDDSPGDSHAYITGIIDYWAACTGIERAKLLFTSYRQVESDVGKGKANDTERVAGLASSIGGGW